MIRRVTTTSARREIFSYPKSSTLRGRAEKGLRRLPPPSAMHQEPLGSHHQTASAVGGAGPDAAGEPLGASPA